MQKKKNQQPHLSWGSGWVGEKKQICQKNTSAKKPQLELVGALEEAEEEEGEEEEEEEEEEASLSAVT